MSLIFVGKVLFEMAVNGVLTGASLYIFLGAPPPKSWQEKGSNLKRNPIYDFSRILLVPCALFTLWAPQSIW